MDAASGLFRRVFTLYRNPGHGAADPAGIGSRYVAVHDDRRRWQKRLLEITTQSPVEQSFASLRQFIVTSFVQRADRYAGVLKPVAANPRPPR